MNFAVEMSEGNRKAAYGQVHKAGCKDLQDPEGFSSEATIEAVQSATEDLLNWGQDEPYTYTLAPCAKALLAPGVGKSVTTLAENNPEYYAQTQREAKS